MNLDDSLGPGRSIAPGLLAVVLLFFGVHAILSDSVMTPARFGGDHRLDPHQHSPVLTRSMLPV